MNRRAAAMTSDFGCHFDRRKIAAKSRRVTCGGRGKNLRHRQNEPEVADIPAVEPKSQVSAGENGSATATLGLTAARRQCSNLTAVAKEKDRRQLSPFSEDARKHAASESRQFCERSGATGQARGKYSKRKGRACQNDELSWAELLVKGTS